MRDIKYLIIHESDTPTGRETTVADIDSWHVDRGFKRSPDAMANFNPDLKAIGYHYCIYIDGSVHTGRQISEIGSHCSGLNSGSIGICLVGRGVYSDAQWAALSELVRLLQTTYPETIIKGHYETPSGVLQGKTCPDFDVHGWIANRFTPDQKNVA